MTAIFFATQAEFRNWLKKRHKKETEIFVGFYKVGSGKPSITWSQAVDQALCFGWIDGVRNSIDKESYCNRFTPRKPASVWSAINIKKAEELIKSGLMTPEGQKAFALRTENKTGIYAHEKAPAQLAQNYERQFRANKTAWKYLQSLAPSYRKLSIHWVMSAKQESTRIKRLNELIADSQLSKNKWKDNKYNGSRQKNNS